MPAIQNPCLPIILYAITALPPILFCRIRAGWALTDNPGDSLKGISKNLCFCFNLTFNSSPKERIRKVFRDALKLKVPTLRNVVLTFPYMLDGSRFSLLQVTAHYRSGIEVNQPTPDLLLKTRIAINNHEKVDLVEFLQALTDNLLLQNARFEQPH